MFWEDVSSLATAAARLPPPSSAGLSRPQRPPCKRPLRHQERLTDPALRGSAPVARRKGLPQSSALRLCRPPLRSALSVPPSAPSSRVGTPLPIAPCYPRLRQVAFGMYMPRFNAEVQTQKREAKCKTPHQPHPTPSHGGASPTCGWANTSSARTP